MFACSPPPSLLSNIPKPDFDFAATAMLHCMPGERTVHRSSNDCVTRIRSESLHDLLSSESASNSGVIIVDCRFPYEFNAGHIIGAKSVTSLSQLCKLYETNLHRNPVIVFHCEFSQNRGPAFANAFRELDRKFNQDCYPKLSYKNVMILDGGFKAFHRHFPELCIGSYLPMRHEGIDLNMLKKCNSNFSKELMRMRNINRCSRGLASCHSQPILKELGIDF